MKKFLRLSFLTLNSSKFCYCVVLSGLSLNGCISKPRVEIVSSDQKISIQILGGAEAVGPINQGKVYLSQCLAGRQAAQSAENNTFLFSSDSHFTTGTTCHIEIEGSELENSAKNIRWLDRPGLMYIDRNVVISRLSTGKKVGTSRNLFRTFEYIQPSSKVVSLTVKITLPVRIELASTLDAQLYCSPNVPYFASFDAKEFKQSGDGNSGRLIFNLSAVSGHAQFSCDRITVFQGLRVVASGGVTGASNFEVVPSSTNIDFPGEFKLTDADTGTSVEIIPEVGGASKNQK